MVELSGPASSGLARQREIQARRFHPTGTFIQFKREDAEGSIPARFEQQVKKYPHRLAFRSRTHALTYDQLNQAANRLAWAILDQRGPGEEPVALLLEQDADMVMGMLGILKAGKIFVALDPAFPLSRNKYILEDTQAPLIVTNHRNLGLAKDLAPNGCTLLNLEQMAPNFSSENPGLPLAPDRLAFILYTSGSTGQPKGVILSHRALRHDIMRRSNLFGVCPEDRLSLLTSGTSEAVRNIFVALFKGASLYSLSIKEEGVAGLADWFIQGQITVYMTGPGPFRRFVETLTGEERFPHLRLIRLGLDTVRKADVEQYKKIFSPECILVHTLGTTECGATGAYFIDKDTEIPDDHVPVGYPVEDMEILLLDDQGQEVGVNRPGEIVVKGRYLSPGYWRKPDVTQASFRPDPSGGDARIYLTGDLGIRRPDGCLLHLGRKDFQVKVRGYRIELAEVELALNSIASVKEAAVVAREDEAGNQRLVAYVVPAQNPGPTVSDLRRDLAPKLPLYMVPSVFVTLSALPLLPNGKINRLALPAPGNERPSLAQDFAAPGTPMEEMLGQIWAGVLSIERVGIHDNFFDLGGNSLLAMRVLARLKKATGLRLNPKELTFQTMGQMASYCEAKLGDAPRQKSQVRAGGLLSRIMGAMGSKKTPTH